MYDKEELLKINSDYDRALKLVSCLFQNKKDKEGQPYIGHLIRVSQNLKEPNTKVAGLLHDVIEDIDFMTYEKLTELNFSEQSINLVKLVTKSTNPKLSYHEEIDKLLASNNIEAIKLKIADMNDNLNPSRLANLSIEKQNYFHNKYDREIIRLKNYLQERGIKND